MMNLLEKWILMCDIWNTDLWLLWVTCDYLFSGMWYFSFFSYITSNLIIIIIINLILLWLFFYIPYKYINNKKIDYFFMLLFLFSLFFLNAKYIIFVIILDIILYFIWYIFKKYNHFKKLSNKQLRYYFMYAKFIPILGYLYSFRIWLTNKLSVRQLSTGVIISSINLIFSFIIIWWFLNNIDWFYRSEILNDNLWWQNERLLYTEIWPFLIIYFIWIILYFTKFYSK